MSQSENSCISRLPYLAIINIFKKLSLRDIQAARLTCKSFNDLGIHLQIAALIKLRKKVDRIENLFIDAKWFKKQQATTNAKLLYIKRMNRGACSVIILAGMIRIAYAATFYFIQKRLLAPLPGALLEDLEKALSFASRRNPLVGKQRLHNLFKQFLRYSRDFALWPNLELHPKLVYKTIIDLLDCLPIRKEQIEVTHLGFHYKCMLPKMMISKEVTDNTECEAKDIIITLMRLGLDAIRRFVYTNQSHFILTNEDLNTCYRLVEFTEAQLSISCIPEEKAEVISLRGLMQVVPVGFRVSLSGTTYHDPHVQEEEDGYPLANIITYASAGCPVGQLPTV